jgi:hypothetical protein
MKKKIKQLSNAPQSNDFWDTLPPHVKDGIIKSIHQAKEGKITPHAEVMKRYKKYL